MTTLTGLVKPEMKVALARLNLPAGAWGATLIALGAAERKLKLTPSEEAIVCLFGLAVRSEAPSEGEMACTEGCL